MRRRKVSFSRPFRKVKKFPGLPLSINQHIILMSKRSIAGYRVLEIKHYSL
jgi:hypothetical protein